MATDPPRVWNKRDPNVPTGAVYVGRPSKWGNRFKLRYSDDADRQRVIAEYRWWLTSDTERCARAKRELRGKHLVCWCAPAPCHAEVLLEIANADD